jgi:hypothetical protein
LNKEGIETETATRYFKSIKENAHEEDIIDMIAASHEYERVNLNRVLLIKEIELQQSLEHGRYNCFGKATFRYKYFKTTWYSIQAR